MLTRYLRGSTAQNNALTLPEGRLCIDEEKKALRLHDGATLGGFEVIGTQAVPPPPGPTSLIGGDETDGFYGPLSPDDFISGDQLATELGLSGGTSHNVTANWLKFSIDGKTLYVAQKTLRYGISWEEIYQAGAVYGDDTNGNHPSGAQRIQDRTVTLDGFTFRVRLARGAAVNPFSDGGSTNGWDRTLIQNSELRRIITLVYDGVSTLYPNTTPPGEWAVFSETDLDLYQTKRTWCQEAPSSNTGARLTYGWDGAYFSQDVGVASTLSSVAWRPVLELID